MKTITKIIHVNDGNSKTVHNGDRLFVETSPRAEAIISAFLTDGWTLCSTDFRVSPAGRQDYYSFFLDGLEFLFTKTVPDDAVDNSDDLLKKAVSEALVKYPEGPYKEEEPDDEDDDDDAWLEDDGWFDDDDDDDEDDDDEDDDDEDDDDDDPE